MGRKKIKILAITDNVIPHEKRIGDKMFTKYFVKVCDAFLALCSSTRRRDKTPYFSTRKRFLKKIVFSNFRFLENRVSEIVIFLEIFCFLKNTS